MFLPDGMGINAVLDYSENKNAKYCLVEKDSADATGIISNLIENEHIMMYEDDNMAHMIHRVYN